MLALLDANNSIRRCIVLKKVNSETETEKENTNENADSQPSSHGTIAESGSIISDNGKYTIQCMTIIGQIEGHYILSEQNKTTKYEHIIPMLAAFEQSSDIDGLLVILNTAGGDIEAGLALAELIAGMRKPTVSLVLGGGHSIGVPIAVAAKRSFIARSATMTIHPVRMNGLMLGVPQAFEYFQRMQQRITRFVTSHSKISAERYNELAMNTNELVMDIGTILDGEDAVNEGLINSIGGLDDAFNALYKMIDKNKPSDKKDKNKNKKTK